MFSAQQVSQGSLPRSADRRRRKLRLRCRRSPGDIVVLTAAIRDLHRAYPDLYVTDVETPFPELWASNPFITTLAADDPFVRTLDLYYPCIDHSNDRPMHFLGGFVSDLERQLGVRIPLTEFKGDIYLSQEEKQSSHLASDRFACDGPFWILVAGGKYDFTAKWWPPQFYQQVVDHFRGWLQFVRCGGGNDWHPPISGVLDLVGQTSLRQLVRLMYDAQGVVCSVTLAMHLAAATPAPTRRLRPCVVIAGGREPPHWEAYPGHQFLHTVGALPCCQTGGCWRWRCQPVGDGAEADRVNLCQRPVQLHSELRVPQCMEMIRPRHVIDAIERCLAFAPAPIEPARPSEEECLPDGSPGHGQSH